MLLRVIRRISRALRERTFTTEYISNQYTHFDVLMTCQMKLQIMERPLILFRF